MDEQNNRVQVKRVTRQNANSAEKLTSVLRSRCYMSGCKNNRICREKQTTMAMFLFPSDLNLAKFWLGICNHHPFECPYHGQTICKDHFQVENLESGSLTDLEGIVLKPNVIPTAKIPNIAYPKVMEYLKQQKEGKSLDATPIGVEFTCLKTFCPVNPNGKPTVIRCYANPKKAASTSNESPSSSGVRITLKRRNPDGTEEVQPGPKIFITAKPKPVNTEKKSPPKPLNLNPSCEVTERKLVLIPVEVQDRITQVMSYMTHIIQDFMAFQIHITHLEQAVVCANEKIANKLSKSPNVESRAYKRFQALNNFLLALYEIHGARSSDVIGYCTKIWRRIVDCHQELKTGGKLKTFITAANGCLVTIVRAIDAISLLKGLWKNLHLKIDENDVESDEDWETLDALISDHIADATEKLDAIDVEVHFTRQKILDIKKPSIRILEITQLDVDSDLIYISTANQGAERQSCDNKGPSNLTRIMKKPRRRSSTVELGEIIEKEPQTSIEQAKTASPVTVVQPQTAEIAPSITIPATNSTLNNFQPSLAYPTMPTMQAQLIPTLQMDAFGNQSVVYQLAYQQVTPTIPQGITVTQNPQYTMMPSMYNTGFQTVSNQQASPTMITAPQNLPPQEPTSYQNTEKPPEEEIVVVKTVPEEEKVEEEVKIKEEPPEEVANMESVEEQPFIKHEPEWNEESEDAQK
ncbi:uncharacterized protein LOC134837229 [Culicoides brevitarsis]|uniref:uncharacterized protein LOC134837229 n=1 Tax=Culicoides brevitarsis TaxID=469753 RepID=UPI00307B23CA